VKSAIIAITTISVDATAFVPLPAPTYTSWLEAVSSTDWLFRSDDTDSATEQLVMAGASFIIACNNWFHKMAPGEAIGFAKAVTGTITVTLKGTR
jgi:hypothetical protein